MKGGGFRAGGWNSNSSHIPKGAIMKTVEVIPRVENGTKLKTLLRETERHLRSGGTTFRRQREGKWKHVKYPGWIKWDETLGGLIVAEVHPQKGESDWQLLQAFIGYLDRHLGSHIESVSIHYR
jgi:hypothetical protein